METDLSKNKIDHAAINFLVSYINLWNKRLDNPEGLPASIYTELLKNRILDPDFTWEKNAILARTKVRPVMELIIANLIKEYFSEGQKILEIGSGNLTSDESYLSSFFKNVSWKFSDIHAISRTHKNIPNYLTLNLTEDSSLNTTEHSFDRIIGCNVLDTIPYSDFPKVFNKMQQLLKPNQLFTHVADLNFYSNAFLDACNDLNFILLPHTNRSRKICRISRSRYDEILAQSESKLTKQEFNALKLWGKQDTRIQAVILGDAILIPVDLSSVYKRIEELFGNELEFLSQQEVFEKHIKEAAEKNGWKVLECGFRSETKDFEKANDSETKPLINYYELNQGQLLAGTDSSVPKGMERLKARLHVFVASNK